ncbi:MAG: hypothetical protein PHQ27_07185 [Victivallales bacterium]|nr:hypothetical protein [Victivallales bacterium]
MAKTTGVLKHYRRKKFFYKLFLRRSAVNAVWFGVTWCFLCGVLFPYLILLVIPLNIIQHRVATAIWLILPAQLLYFYGIIVQWFAYHRMARSCTSSRRWRDLAGATALISPLNGIVLVPLMIRRQQWWGTAWSILSLGLVGSALWWRNHLSSAGVYGLILGGIMALLAAMACWRERPRRQWRYLWPLAVTVLGLVGIGVYSSNLERDLQRDRAAISQLVGHAIALPDFWERQRQGLSYDIEPLRTLIATNPTRTEDRNSFSWVPAQPTAFYRHRMTVFRHYPKFLAAAATFLTGPVQAVGHLSPTDAMHGNIDLPELPAWGCLAVYLSCDLIAHASDPVVVRQRNAELERVRDWCRADFGLISQLAGMKVERMRLEALTYPLATGRVAPAEWRQLVGPEVDWRTNLVTAIGDEATMFQSIYQYVVSIQFRAVEKEFGRNKVATIIGLGKKYLPSWLAIHFQRDYRFALAYYLRSLRLLTAPDLTPTEISHRLNEDCDQMTQTLRKNYFVLSGMLVAAVNDSFVRIVRMEDFRRLALIAGQVEEYRRKHGCLPDSLSFMLQTPLGSLQRLPVVYEHGDLEVYTPEGKATPRYGFRLHFPGLGGTNSSAPQNQNIFTVLLPRPEETKGQ